jgi:hypothetical protein
MGLLLQPRSTPVNIRVWLNRAVVGAIVATVCSLAVVKTARAQIVNNGSFESPSEPQGYYYNPTDTYWTFASESGIITPPSGFNGPYPAADGSQYAFLQSNNSGSGLISQSITLPTSLNPPLYPTSLGAEQEYGFSDQQAYRAGYDPPSYQVQLNGTQIGPTQVAPSSSFSPSSFPFAATPGTYTLGLQAVSAGPNTDSTTFIDSVAINPAVAATGTFATRPFYGDSTSGIYSGLASTYTHAVDLNGSGETINGVTFVGGGSSGANYTLSSVPNSYPFFANNLQGNISSLDSNFYYDGTSTEQLTLSGLTPGQTYVATFYNVAFGNPGGRIENITDSQGGAVTFDENYTGNGNGNLLQDIYTAQGTSITFGFTATDAQGDSFHQYGFSNAASPFIVYDQFDGINGNGVNGRTPDTVNLHGGYWTTNGVFPVVITASVGNPGSSMSIGPQSTALVSVASAGNYVKPAVMIIQADISLGSISGTDMPFRGVALGFDSAGSVAPPDNGNGFDGILIDPSGNLDLLTNGNTTTSLLPYNAAVLGVFNPSTFYTLSYEVNTLTGDLTNIYLSDLQGSEFLADAGTNEFTDFETNFAGIQSSGNQAGQAAYVDNFIVAVPEPASLCLFGIGGLMLGALALRPRRG